MIKLNQLGWSLAILRNFTSCFHLVDFPNLYLKQQGQTVRVDSVIGLARNLRMYRSRKSILCVRIMSANRQLSIASLNRDVTRASHSSPSELEANSL